MTKKQYKNKGKAAFAKEYNAWIRGGRNGPMPDYTKHGIGYMAAQSIWLK